MRSIRPALINASVAAGALVLLAVIAELALQAITLVGRPRFTRLDSVLGWNHNPGVTEMDETEGHRYRVTYNSHGYRVPEWTVERSPARARVVVIGDSFVDGSEVADDELLTARLQADLAGPEVINLGVYGFQSAQQSLLLDSLGLRLSPDLVVVVGIPNDLPGNVLALESFGPAPRFVLDGDSIRLEDLGSASAREARRISQLPAPDFVRRRSLVYHLLNTKIFQRLASRRILEFSQARIASASGAEMMELTARIVERMHANSRARGADFVYVLAYLRDELPAGAPDAFKGLRARLETAGVPVLDLRDSLRAAQATSDRSLYYDRDIHWTARGHAEVARLLAPMIRTRLEARLAARAGTPGQASVAP